MDVKDAKKFPENPAYSIEWGDSTWTEEKEEKEKSIRNRYENSLGKFNYAGSSEIPWADFNLMIIESLKRDKFSKEEVAELLASIADFYRRNL